MGIKAKEIVKLRFKTLKNGEKSAYFDIYRNGMREYLWQDEHLLPENDKASIEHNREVLIKLEERRRSLVAELTIDKSGVTNRAFNTDITLAEWLDAYQMELVERVNRQYITTMDVLRRHLMEFNANLLIKDVDEDVVSTFYEHLKKTKAQTNEGGTLTEGYIWNLLKILSNCMNGAIRARLIDINPCKSILYVCRRKQNKRDLSCLSQNELLKLIDTPYRMPEYKRMFLFACHTGASICSIRQLLWKHIYKKEGRTWAIIKQTRSGKEIDIPLTDLAAACLPPRCRAKGSSPIFDCKSKKVIYDHIIDWGREAGIETSLNFRVAKNTYASLLLNADADLYTAGYMMGFSTTKYMEEYEGYLNGKRYDEVEKFDDEIGKIIVKLNVRRNASDE